MVAGLAFVTLSILLLVAFGMRFESEGGGLAASAASAPNTYAASVNADAGAAIKVISSSGFASLVEQAKTSEVMDPPMAADLAARPPPARPPSTRPPLAPTNPPPPTRPTRQPSTPCNHDQRGRKMVDYTREPETNDLQTIMNTWSEGSYSPVHKHTGYAETFVVLEGTLIFFTWGAEGGRAPATCHVLSSEGPDRGIIVEKVTCRT